MSLSAATHTAISTEVDRLADDLLADLQSVVRIPSVVGNEGPVSARMRQLYEGAGLGLEVSDFVPDIDALRSHPGFVDTQMPYAGRSNVIGRLPAAGEGRSLILNGHIDVVGPGPDGSWSRDPWGAEIEGNWMYGRGAGDMKAGVIANLYAMKTLANLGLRPAGEVMLQAVIDEEAGGAGGTLASLERGHRADAMICTEPENLNITMAHAGVCYFRVRVAGRQAHAAFAHRGVNAIAHMVGIVQALVDLDAERGRTIHYALLDGGSGRSCHLNVGTIRAGDWPSSVPAEAVIECRMGFVPGEHLADMRALLTRTINDAAAGDQWLVEHPPKIEWYGWQTDPWYQDPDHPFICTLAEVIGEVRGEPAELRGATGGIDSRFSRYYGMAAACTGPIAQNIHGADERVDIPSIITTTKILASTVLAWCGMRP